MKEALVYEKDIQNVTGPIFGRCLVRGVRWWIGHGHANENEPASIQTFTESDVAVTPVIEEYDFTTAKDMGSMQQIRGIRAGTQLRILTAMLAWMRIGIMQARIMNGLTGLIVL